jgi:hypothetical protein
VTTHDVKHTRTELTPEATYMCPVAQFIYTLANLSIRVRDQNGAIRGLQPQYPILHRPQASKPSASTSRVAELLCSQNGCSGEAAKQCPASLLCLCGNSKITDRAQMVYVAQQGRRVLRFFTYRGNRPERGNTTCRLHATT